MFGKPHKVYVRGSFRPSIVMKMMFYDVNTISGSPSEVSGHGGQVWSKRQVKKCCAGSEAFSRGCRT